MCDLEHDCEGEGKAIFKEENFFKKLIYFSGLLYSHVKANYISNNENII